MRFAKPGDAQSLETGTGFTPRFDEHGLISAIVVDAQKGDVVMLAHMNEEALARTMDTGEAWFWSRSRKALWRKGETSGNTLSVSEILVDCDQDAVLIRANLGGKGVACHTGRRSCFYRRLDAKAGSLAFV